MDDLDRVADEVGILHEGRLIMSRSLEKLQHETRRVQIVFEGQRVPAGFALPDATRVETEGPVYSAVCSACTEGFVDSLRQRHGSRVQIFPLRLEDVFIAPAFERRRVASPGIEKNVSTKKMELDGSGGADTKRS